MASIIAKDQGGKVIPLIDAGMYQGRCIGMYHIGTITEEILGKTKTLNKVRLVFELPSETFVFDDEKGEEVRRISKDYTVSLHEKASLRKELEAWRAKPFTPEELEGFDLIKVLGIPASVTVKHKVSGSNGKTYNEIASLSPIMKGMTAADQVHESKVFAYDQAPEEMIAGLERVPGFVLKKIEKAKEFEAVDESVKTWITQQLADQDGDEAPAEAPATQPTQTTQPAQPAAPGSEDDAPF